MSVAAGVSSAFEQRPPAWIAAFLEDPVDSLTVLFTGRWYHGSLNAEDPEELLLDWADGLAGVPGFSELLDQSLATWFARRWRAPVHDDVPELTWHRALLAAAALHEQLPRTVAELRARQAEAPDLLGPMTRGITLDPMGWYWTCLAQSQADEGLRARWWAMCELVPGTPWFHGRIGLLGLRRIPGPDRGRFRESVAFALLRLTSALDAQVDARMLKQSQAERATRAAARELRSAYPFPQSWDLFWDAHHRDLEERPRGWLIAALGEPRRGTRRRTPRTATMRFDKGWPDRARALADRLRNGDLDAIAAAEDLIVEQVTHASATGDRGGLVRTLCQLSAATLALDPARALAWAEDARRWDPWNPFSWTTAVRALSASRDESRALTVSLEAVERFPDDVVARTCLAEVLRASGDLDAAQATYHDTIARFPNNEVARNGLASVMRELERRLARRPDENALEIQGSHGSAPPSASRDAPGAQRDHRTAPPPATTPQHESALDDDDAGPVAMSTAATTGDIRPLRSLLLLARLRSGAGRARLFATAHAQVDALLEQTPHHAELLFTKLELLLDAGRHDDAREALGALPGYLVRRPEFLAMAGRLNLEVLLSLPKERYSAARLESVLRPWEEAGRQHSALNLNVPLVRLRTSSLVYDGAALDEIRQGAVEALRNIVIQPAAEISSSAGGQRNTALRSWWRGQLANVLPALDGTDDAKLSYESAESCLSEQPELLSGLERELIDASRYSSGAS